jgi:hypothetical protein
LAVIGAILVEIVLPGFQGFWSLKSSRKMVMFKYQQSAS